MTSDAIASVPHVGIPHLAPGRIAIAPFARWLADFERRLALHDGGVELLAHELARRDGWHVQAEAPGFPTPRTRSGLAPDIVCDRGRETPPIIVEVELPETLVRKDTVRRLRGYVDAAYDTHVVVVADTDDHDDAIEGARRMLECVGLTVAVGAVAPDRRRVTGLTW